MQTNNLDKFDQLLDSQIDADIDALKGKIASIKTQRIFAPTMKRLRHFFPHASAWCLPGVVHFDVEITRIKDIEPALALFEEETGVTFSRTSDSASENYATREYKTECGKLVVNATIRGDSPTCRSVPDGEEVVKKYKLVCDDDIL